MSILEDCPNSVSKLLRPEYTAKDSIDTRTIHKWLYKNAGDSKQHFNGGSAKTDLFSVVERCGIPVTAGHNALADACITAQLFQRCICFFKSQGLKTLGDLINTGRA